MMNTAQSRFLLFAKALLGYNLGVIAWGAYVRATGSGAGCGRHWPTCDGQVIPLPKSAAMLVEFSHRASSGLVLIFAVILAVMAFRTFSAGHAARRGALLVVLFTIAEALLGAGLVLFELVARNDSAARAVAMSLHLMNTFLLLAAVAYTVRSASGAASMKLRGQGAVGIGLVLSLVGVIMLGMSGAVTALGDTLFPAQNLLSGMKQDVSPTAHFLVRMRMLHPMIAVSIGLLVLLMAGVAQHLRPSEQTKRAAQWVTWLFIGQIALGLVNLILLAPVPLQMAHLVMADATWLALVFLTMSAMSSDVEAVELRDAAANEVARAEPGPPAEPRASAVEGRFRASWRDYLALTKPRVISLLLFTTLAAMFIAAEGWPGGWMLVAVAVGGYMAAGSANAINMVIDRDIDGRMRRTATRPTVTRRVSSRSALMFALALEVLSFSLLWWAANLLTAVLALAGLVFYVLVYTLALKRRTWQNIVIGGAAGAFPPLVGWAAVTGELNALAWTLFAIIFLWTPVHFWALALMIKDDYAEAGIPMLPVVLGERVTVLQIAFYAVLTAAISIVPFVQGDVSWVYLLLTAGLNVVLLLRSLRLCRTPERPQALSLFKYSMVYLALLFLIMAIDRTSWMSAFSVSARTWIHIV